MCCAWFAHDCAPGHLSVRVGDGSRRSEETVKKSRIAPFSAIIIIIITKSYRHLPPSLTPKILENVWPLDEESSFPAVPSWVIPRTPNMHNRLVGLVVKASASRAEGPGFESRLRQDFFGAESYQWLENWHSSGYPARRLAL